MSYENYQENQNLEKEEIVHDDTLDRYIDGASEMNDQNQGRKNPFPATRPIKSGLYYVIPSEVLEDERLEHSEIVFYALLSGIAWNDGYCYAGNKHFSKRMRAAERTIKYWLQRLEKFGYVRVESHRKGIYWFRKIYICHARVNSKNVCEGQPIAQPKGNPLPNRRATHCPIVSEDKKVSEDKEKRVREAPAKRSPPAPPLLEKGKFVRISLEGLKRLYRDLGSDITERIIEEMNDYLESHGKKGYKNYEAALRNWARRDFKKESPRILSKEESFKRENMAVARQAQSQLRVAGAPIYREFFIAEKELVRLDTGKRISLFLPLVEFEKKMIEIFGLVKTED